MKLFVITGTCGAGKSTMKDYLSKRLTNELYVPVDVDEVGLNWWDYAQVMMLLNKDLKQDRPREGLLLMK